MLNDTQWEFIKSWCADSEIEQYAFEGDWGNWNYLWHELQRLAWRTISEAPRDKHEAFLVCSYKYWPPYVVVNAANDCPLKDEYPWRTHQSGHKIHKSLVTHFMPLPPTPKEGE